MPSAPIALSLTLLLAFQNTGKSDDWHKVTSKVGGFSVTLPGKAELSTVTQKTDEGPIEVNMIISKSDGVTYIATRAESKTPITPDKTDAFFAKVLEGYATGRGKTLQQERRSVFKGMPVCYIRIGVTEANGKSRVEQTRFIIGDPTNLHTLQVLVPKGVNVNKDIKRFYDSFERTDPAPVKTAATKPKGTSAKAKLTWKTFAPAGKGFSVSMPGEPKLNKQDTPDGSTKVDNYTLELTERVFTAVSYEFPPSVAKQDPGTTLENICKGFIGGMKAKLIELKPVKDAGLEGREVSFEFSVPNEKIPAAGMARAYIVGSHAYLFMSVGEKGASDSADAKKFLDSFQLSKGSSDAKPKAKAKSKGRS